ncbi:MMPL family transporter [Microbacterium marmarense]|uniref:MMPL family transporter n=1 Tax=Microbacterium marmarense TaxID=3122051 RepID=A0ABU8LSR8_9MICO
MSTLLYSLGRWSYNRPWRVLVGWLLLLAIAGSSAAVFMKGTDNSFSIPGSESQEGLELLSRSFPSASGASATLIVGAADGDNITEAPYDQLISDAIVDLESVDGVAAVADPFDGLIDGTIADDESAAIVTVQLDGDATSVSSATTSALTDIAAELRETLPEGANAAMGGELFAAAIPALSLIEAVGVLIALFVLIVTFRSFAVAWFPLVSALIGVGLAISLILVSTAFASVSSTTPMLAIMLGLAVGIDYALFIVARHQDQVREGIDPEESVARATGTAGSAVVFAGITVLIALIGLSFAGIPFLTTMGVAAAVAVAIAVVVAVTLTPALLGFSKGRVVGWGFAKKKPAQPTEDDEEQTVVAHTPPKSNRWVMLVTKHPLVTTIAVIVGLGVMAVPASSLALALPNAGVQPTSSEARQAYDLTAETFGPGANGPLIMTGTIVTSTDPLGLMDDLATEIEAIPGVKEVALSTPNETADTGLIQIIPETAPDAPETAELVRTLRDQHDRLLEEYGVDLKVTGFTAVGIDVSDRLGAALVPFGIFVVGLSLILLMIVFRSIWVPLMAAGGYLLSVAASFGVVAAVFEWGWFADALHVAKVGPIISFMPILLMGVLFGLAMDYQVFLVSRMREDYVHAVRAPGGAADRKTALGAVRSGFTASARVVTAAAVIMFAVFVAFVPEGDSSIKPIALGLAAGIAIDAFLVRMTLIPALMALLGEKSWWIPRWLDKALPHFDIEGEAVQRELELANWPEPNTSAAVVGENVAVHADGGNRNGEVTLFAGATFRVEPGSALVVTGDARAGRAFALAVAGRITPDQGLLRVGGHLLPGRAAWVRAHVGVALLSTAEHPVKELRSALAGNTRTVVIEAPEVLEGAERDQAAAVLRDAIERASERGAALTVVTVSRAEGPALSLLAEARFSDVASIGLTQHPSPTPSTAEVNA